MSRISSQRYVWCLVQNSQTWLWLLCIYNCCLACHGYYWHFLYLVYLQFGGLYLCPDSCAFLTETFATCVRVIRIQIHTVNSYWFFGHLLWEQDIDKDGDGLISTIELRQALAEMGVKLSDAEFDEVVQDASDGHLDFTNFVKAMMAQSEFWQWTDLCRSGPFQENQLSVLRWPDAYSQHFHEFGYKIIGFKVLD